MKEETRKKLWKKAEYNWPENNEEHCNFANAYMMGATDLMKEVWHDASKEKPVYDSDIAVTRHLSGGLHMSVCAMVSDDIIYSPVARKEYKWGSCPFTHWAYIEDLLPNGKED